MQPLYNFNRQPQIFTTESSLAEEEKNERAKTGDEPRTAFFLPPIFLGLTSKPLSTHEINTVVKLLLPFPVSTLTHARLPALHKAL